MADQEHPSNVMMRPEVLDATVKSVMQSITANNTKRRRVQPKSQAGRDAARDSELLSEALGNLLEAQNTSFDGQT